MRQQLFTSVLLIALCAAVSLSNARAAESDAWATGAAIGQQLAVPVSISWTNLPLARALKSLGTAQHMAVVLDRRVDPERPITLAIDQEPLREALEKIARHLALGYCQFGPVALLWPSDDGQTAADLGGTTARRAAPECRHPSPESCC